MGRTLRGHHVIGGDDQIRYESQNHIMSAAINSMIQYYFEENRVANCEIRFCMLNLGKIDDSS